MYFVFIGAREISQIVSVPSVQFVELRREPVEPLWVGKFIIFNKLLFSHQADSGEPDSGSGETAAPLTVTA